MVWVFGRRPGKLKNKHLAEHLWNKRPLFSPLLSKADKEGEER
jgi:hypothetical protein